MLRRQRQGVGVIQVADEPKTFQVQITPEQMQTMLHAPVPRLYANGFGLAQTAADISVILLLNSAPVGVLTMSMISAKTLTTELSKAIETYEQKTKTTVPTMQEVATALGVG